MSKREAYPIPSGLAQHIIRADPDNPPRIVLYSNCCDHEITRHGNDWRCVENCRCMMIGCIPKVWHNAY